jgi:hypothetical protein
LKGGDSEKVFLPRAVRKSFVEFREGEKIIISCCSTPITLKFIK